MRVMLWLVLMHGEAAQIRTFSRQQQRPSWCWQSICTAQLYWHSICTGQAHVPWCIPSVRLTKHRMLVISLYAS